MGRFFRIVLGCIFVGAILYSILSLRVYHVSGDSMEPELRDGEYVIVDRITLHGIPLRRGELVVYYDTNNTPEIKIKRVLGLPTEKLEIAEGKVMAISGNMKTDIDEPYLGEHVRTCLPGACTDLTPRAFDIPDDSYFVLGDNRGNSRDSRGCADVGDCSTFSPIYIPEEEIIGRVIWDFSTSLFE